MSIFTNQVWGIIFLVVAATLMLLMFRAWAYPYDKETHKSAAPRRLVWTHRALGWVYVAIYLYLMLQMVPRLWTYQVELPARTVAHLVLGLSIGGLLFTKLIIVRFFSHLEAKLVPLLGTLLFLCTLVMVMLALPLTLRESFLQESITAGDMLSKERVERLKIQLPNAGVTDPERIAALTTTQSLLAGRRVLTGKCTQCHDLRTVLVRPRTPENWAQTVKRMANRSNVLRPISDDEQLKVTAYLLAISPTLQKSLMQRRELVETNNQRQQSASVMLNDPESMTRDSQDFDVDEARAVFEVTCSQCHAFQLVDTRPPSTRDEILALIKRMVANGLAMDAATISTVTQYLVHTYAKDDASAAAAPQSIDSPAADATSIGDMSLADASGCTGCHSVDIKILGPAWRDVATRYANDPDAFTKLVEKVKAGGEGNWTDETGGVSMPANFPRVSEDDIRRLVRFVLSLNSVEGDGSAVAETNDSAGAPATDNDALAIVEQSGCTACHGGDTKIIGPSFTAIAARYQGDDDAKTKLTTVVKNGGMGNWTELTGGIPMPAQAANLSDSDIGRLIDIILEWGQAEAPR